MALLYLIVLYSAYIMHCEDAKELVAKNIKVVYSVNQN